MNGMKSCGVEGEWERQNDFGVRLFQRFFYLQSKYYMKFWTSQKASEFSPKLTFKQQYSSQERTQKANALKVKHHNDNFLPTVVEGLDRFNDSQKGFMLMALDKQMSIMYLIEYLRKLMKLKKNQSIFIEAGKKIVDMSVTLSTLYEKYSEGDGFVYLKVKTEDSY